MKTIILFFLFSVSLFAFSEFPRELKVENINPFNNEVFEQVKVGQTHFVRSWKKRHLYRYVVLFNKDKYIENITDVPSLEEYCHEAGDRVASWSFAKSYSRTIDVGVDFNLIGIDIGVSKSYSSSFDVEVTRWIQAIEGISALHTAQLQFERHEGIIYKQVYNLKTNKVSNIELKSNQFYVDRINPVFKIKRDILERCK